MKGLKKKNFFFFSVNNYIYTHTAIQKFGISKKCNVFKKFIMLTKAVSGCIFDKKQNKKKTNFVKYFCNLKVQFSILIYLNIIYSCEAKLNFQHHYSSHQCHMILQKSF